MKIMLSAGEVSGDLHASYLIKEIKKLRPDLSFFGIGSAHLAAEGVDIQLDLTRRGTIGISEALPNLLPLYLAFKKAQSMLKKERPALVLLIDSQGFNLPLAQYCKKLGIKTAYYIPPQEWLWGTPSGVKKAADSIGLIISIFEKEYQAYKKAGGNVVYFGHPSLDIVKPTLGREAARNYFVHAAPSAKIIALCPGSRTQEIQNIAPLLLEAAKIILAELPNTYFLIPAATKQISNALKLILHRRQLDLTRYKVVEGQNYDALNASDLALCASGTINLEASILGTPNLMVYKLSPLTYWIGKNILKIDQKLKYFSMPNILLDAKIVPELIMSEANPKNIANTALSILNSPPLLDKMKKAFMDLQKKLGPPGALRNGARAVLNFVG